MFNSMQTPDKVPEISPRRVGEQINLISQHKSSGFPNVPANLIKMALQTIPLAFTELLNLCLTSSTFPQTWKRASVVCIPKAGDNRRLNNLKPISFLPVTGKILEFFLNEAIVGFLKKKPSPR